MMSYASITDEDLTDEFSTFDINLDNEDVIDKLKELCVLYRIDASNIADEWVAYSHTKKVDTPLNVDTLSNFEKEKLNRKAGKNKTPKHGSTKKVIYNADTFADIVDNNLADDFLEAYSTPGAKEKIKKRQVTPDNPPTNKRLTGLNGTPVPFSPNSFSPANFSPTSATPSKKYNARPGKGEIVCSHGPTEKVNWQGQGQRSSCIEPYTGDGIQSLESKYKYMFQKVTDKAHVLSDMIDEMGAKLQKHHSIEEVAHISLPVQEPVTIIGRVCCDGNGKLNAKSLILEGSRETSNGKTVPLDVTGVPQYSLFPGQIIAAEGLNSTGSKFMASKIYEGVPPTPAAPMSIEDDLHMVIAAGPFTTSDSTAYEPLVDLVKSLQRDKPDVCILIGPFVDIKNPEVDKLTEMTYEELFLKNITSLVDAIERLHTQLIIVPSQRDAHHESVYPQPSFVVPELAKNKKIHFMPDPSMLTIDGVVVGVMATDTLFDLGKEETSSNAGSDRLGRLVSHIMTQQNCYPLYPPMEEVNIDYDHFEVYAGLSVVPHILITPSDLKYFIKDIHGCCCVNPGRLAKGLVGGTYSRLVVSSSLQPQIAAKVVKI
ncbi:unnamed protein product [Owenia fusiformis]|uniref:DNA polymerase alpha subunit B n=1 Tax=Owenia fusiformis TaxID=6347 RepID=A0A8J1U6E2_OWEFU|nr:unnamed protein product [Owenia fusiformis]